MARDVVQTGGGKLQPSRSWGMCNSIDIEFGGADTGIPAAVAVAVAVGDPLRVALAVLGADLGGNLSVHDAVH